MGTIEPTGGLVAAVVGSMLVQRASPRGTAVREGRPRPKKRLEWFTGRAPYGYYARVDEAVQEFIYF